MTDEHILRGTVQKEPVLPISSDSDGALALQSILDLWSEDDKHWWPMPVSMQGHLAISGAALR
jgi:hypothetical protein